MRPEDLNFDSYKEQLDESYAEIEQQKELSALFETLLDKAVEGDNVPFDNAVAQAFYDAELHGSVLPSDLRISILDPRYKTHVNLAPVHESADWVDKTEEDLPAFRTVHSRWAHVVIANDTASEPPRYDVLQLVANLNDLPPQPHDRRGIYIALDRDTHQAIYFALIPNPAYNQEIFKSAETGPDGTQRQQEFRTDTRRYIVSLLSPKKQKAALNELRKAARFFADQTAEPA